MLSLKLVQERFINSLIGGGAELELGASPVAAQTSWAIYRQNYRANHINALADTYSTVQNLVGEAYFRQLARRFLQAFPSVSGDLNDYGAEFSDFIRDSLPHMPGGDELAYLPDIACLDWAWFEALRAPDAPSWAIEQSASWAAEQWQNARVRPHPACRLLISEFPIYRIRQVAYGEADGADIGMGSEAVLISRPGAVRLTRLNASEAGFVDTWFQGAVLEQALESALAREPDFHFTDMLRRLVALQAISKCGELIC